MGVEPSDLAESFVDSVPVVGHIKAMFHYANNDTTKGNQAMKRANRTTLVVGVGLAIGATGGLAGVALAPATLGGVGAVVTGEAYDCYHRESKIMSAIDGVKTGAKEMKNGNILEGLGTGVSSVGKAGIWFALDFAAGFIGARLGHKLVPGIGLAKNVNPTDNDFGDMQKFGEPTTENLGVQQDINRVATKSTQIPSWTKRIMYTLIPHARIRETNEVLATII